MQSRLPTLSAFAFSVSALVAPVPGVAQSVSSAQPVLARFSETVAHPYVVDRAGPAAIAALPVNLVMPGFYRPVIEGMRARSPTFRRQCARIASVAQLQVVIESEPPGATFSHPMALTTINRYQYGRIRAIVRVGISTRTPELIAHELEHVIEQLDGVDLRAKADLPSSGVRVCDGGGPITYETRRAVATGLRVAEEIAQQMSPGAR